MACIIRLKCFILFVICTLAISIFFFIKKFDGKLCKKTHNSITNIQENSKFDLMSASSSNCEVIHIVIICDGSKSSRQVVTLFKSLLFHRKNPIHAHFVSGSSSKLVLSHLFQTWNIPDLTISFYSAELHLHEVSWIPNSHYSGIYGLLKVVVLQLLPIHIKKVILLDTDLIFCADIARLWNYFNLFKPNEAIGLVENQSDWYLGTLWINYMPWPAMGRGFNTGVMLLNCEKLRVWGWEKMWKNKTRLTLKKHGNLTLADQDIINNILNSFPTLVHLLPCEWNMQLSENVKIELCLAKHMDKVCVLHLNSPKKNALHHVVFKSLLQKYQLYEDLNGDLLSFPLLHCKMGFEKNLYNTYNENHFCKIISENNLLPRRTHLFYLPFSYNQNGKGDVSIVVQLSFKRLSAFERLCSSWRGVVSAVIFLSDIESSQFLNFIANSNVLQYRTNIAYHLVYKNANDNVYPINLLRNIALKNAVTEFVFLCDVDFMLMPSLYEYIISFISSSYVFEKNALIIPAFSSIYFNLEIPITKSQLLAALDNGYISTFQKYVWEKGHYATNFNLWKKSSHPYSVNWTCDFEPYVVLQKKNCPMYDTRFSGFGWNKVSHIMELDASGFRFIVLPFAFIIHIPHTPSNELLKYRTSSKYRNCLQKLKYEFADYLLDKYNKIYNCK